MKNDDIGMFGLEDDLRCPICDENDDEYEIRIFTITTPADDLIDESSIYVDENNCHVLHNDNPKVIIYECRLHGLKKRSWKKCTICDYQFSEDVVEKIYDLT